MVQVGATDAERGRRRETEQDLKVDSEQPKLTKRLALFILSTDFKLYCSYFLSSWGDRMWSFALSLALGVVGGDLMFTAASGFANAASVLLFGASIGSWIDRTSRLRATPEIQKDRTDFSEWLAYDFMRMTRILKLIENPAASICLIVNNVGVAISAGILVILLYVGNADYKLSPTAYHSLVAISVVSCAVSVLGNMGTKICITRDWIVVICAGDANKLAKLNGTLVSISLVCLVVSPLAVGQIMTGWSVGWGCAFVGIWNVLSAVIEYPLLLSVYRSCPALAVKPPSAVDEDRNATVIGRSLLPFAGRLCASIKSLMDSYRNYLRHSVMPAGMAAALLYLTVLSFDGVSIVYLKWQGLSENLIAVCQGLGAIVGLAGSVIYPRLRRRIGVRRTGMVALIWEWSWLLLPVASVWLPGSNFDPKTAISSLHYRQDTPTIGNFSTSTSVGCALASDSVLAMLSHQNWSRQFCNLTSAFDDDQFGDYASRHRSISSVAVFLAGMILSRFGLWMADLSTAQIFQEDVVEHERGSMNGVQNALNNLMIILISIVVIFLPDPRMFGILAMISWLAIFSSFCSFCIYCRVTANIKRPNDREANENIEKSPTNLRASTIAIEAPEDSFHR